MVGSDARMASGSSVGSECGQTLARNVEEEKSHGQLDPGSKILCEDYPDPGEEGVTDTRSAGTPAEKAISCYNLG